MYSLCCFCCTKLTGIKRGPLTFLSAQGREGLKGAQGNNLTSNYLQRSEVDEKQGMFYMAQEVTQGLMGDKE